MTDAVETRALVKTFGSTRALDGVDLTIRRGSVYGLLGPNGAGKTTAIRVLTTLLKPTSGRVSVLGHDVVSDAAVVRQKVSLTGQYASVGEDLTGQENLILVSRLLGLSWRDAGKRATDKSGSPVVGGVSRHHYHGEKGQFPEGRHGSPPDY
jgi:ABC-2 type transport system ATP-binding protein